MPHSPPAPSSRPTLWRRMVQHVKDLLAAGADAMIDVDEGPYASLERRVRALEAAQKQVRRETTGKPDTDASSG